MRQIVGSGCQKSPPAGYANDASQQRKLCRIASNFCRDAAATRRWPSSHRRGTLVLKSESGCFQNHPESAGIETEFWKNKREFPQKPGRSPPASSFPPKAFASVAVPDDAQARARHATQSKKRNRERRGGSCPTIDLLVILAAAFGI